MVCLRGGEDWPRESRHKGFCEGCESQWLVMIHRGNHQLVSLVTDRLSLGSAGSENELSGAPLWLKMDFRASTTPLPCGLAGVSFNRDKRKIPIDPI